MGQAAAAAGAVIPVLGQIFGAIQQTNQQNANENFINTTLGNVGQADTQASAYAKQLASGLPFQTLLNAQKGGIQTLKSQVGGLPNEGALVKQLFGGNIENALESSINTRDAALSNAIAAELGVGNQYAGLAGAAMRSPTSNPWTGVASGVGGLFGAGGPFGSSGASGASSSLDTSMIPAAGSGWLSLPPDLSSGLPAALPDAVG